MLLDCVYYWKQVSGFWSAPRRRRHIPNASRCSETLESRCLLSAVNGRHIVADEQTVDADADGNEQAKQPRGAKAFQVMNVAGTWDITYRGIPNFTGTLTIQQNGKRLTGTLANDGQPTTTFTARFVKKNPIADTAVGKGLNYAAASKKTKLVLHFVDANADKLPETGDGHYDGPEGGVDFDMVRQFT